MEEKDIIDVEVKEEEINKKEEKSEKVKKEHKFLKTAGIIVACGVMGIGGGFAGAHLAMYTGSAAPKEVLYQSVIQTNADGSAVSGMTLADVAANVRDSVVEITTSTVETSPFFQQYITSGAGSGVIVSSDGLIITNHHVIDGATSITVRLANGEEYDAELVASDQQTDVAVIRIRATGLKPAVLGDSDELVVGEEVIAVGNPLGSLGGTVTDGIISALDREVTIDGQTMTLLQTSAAISPGNSGGGLFNTRGELIGIVNAKSSGTDVEGLGFAIPVNVVKDVAQDLIETGQVQGRLTLGISYLEISSLQTAQQYGVNVLGLYISEVTEGSNADRAGLQPNDIIIAVDNEQVTTSAELRSALNNHEAGDTMTFTVIRDRQYVELSVVLEA